MQEKTSFTNKIPIFNGRQSIGQVFLRGSRYFNSVFSFSYSKTSISDGGNFVTKIILRSIHEIILILLIQYSSSVILRLNDTGSVALLMHGWILGTSFFNVFIIGYIKHLCITKQSSTVWCRNYASIYKANCLERRCSYIYRCVHYSANWQAN